SIGDQLFVDLDNNGVFDPAIDSVIANVTVTLTLPSGETIDTISDANGEYLFEGLAPGDYSVTVDINDADFPAGVANSIDPDGGNDNTSDVTLTSTIPSNLDQDFGYTGMGSIGDQLFVDLDNNGEFDPKIDAPIANVTVTLTLPNGKTVETTTDEHGTYSFTGLTAGDYTVTVDTNDADFPAGVVNSIDPDGVNDNTADLTLAANEMNIIQDFGYNGTGSIGDQLFVDVNNDGVFDPTIDEVIANVTVTLTLPSGKTITTETDGDGKYLFTYLAPGDYSVTVDTNDTDFPAGVVNSIDPDMVNDNTADLTLAADEANLDQDFGYTGTASVGNTVWFDTVLDGIYEELFEDGVEGVTVNLYNTDDVLIGSAITDVNGGYLIDSLVAGQYYVEFVAPDGQTFTLNNTGDGRNDSDVTRTNGEGTTNTFILNDGENKDDIDAGLITAVVPVELTYFTGEALENDNLLEWETAVEIDNDYFEIQRMENGGSEFETIGKVNGFGNTTDLQSYSFLDRNVDNGSVYLYRLKQVDFNGAFEYSNIVKIERANDHIDINLFPNPTTDYINVDFNNELDGDAKIQIINGQGQLVKIVSAVEDLNSIQIDVTDLASGNYYINIIKNNLTINKSFIKI
ncbi:SdrD B-like domain-containing protein, partial [Portibacter lacus]